MAQAGLKLLSTRNLPASASQSAGITDMSHHSTNNTNKFNVFSSLLGLWQDVKILIIYVIVTILGSLKRHSYFFSQIIQGIIKDEFIP